MGEATTTLKATALTTTTALRMGKTAAVGMNTNAPFVMNTVAEMAATEVLPFPAVHVKSTIAVTTTIVGMAPAHTNMVDQVAMMTTREQMMIEAMVGMLSVLVAVIEAEVKVTMETIAIGPAAANEDGVTVAAVTIPEKADDPDVLKKVEFCARPQTRGRSGRTVPLKVNYFGVEIASGPNQIFKYHVTVERSIDRDEEDKYGPQRGGQDGREHAESGTDATPQPEQRPERPLQRALMSVVVNTVLRQNNDEFAGIRVVHDGMAAIYSPVKLPWTSKTFEDVSPYSWAPPSTATTVGDGVARRRPRTFIVKMELVETIGMTSLLEHYSDPGVNVMPVLQALDVVVRHLACQRLTVVGRDLYTLKEAHTLHGGKELCWGYHQAIRKAKDKLVLNLNETSAIFYTPGPLMQLVLSTLRIKDPRNARSLSKQELKTLAHALRNVEVKPTHREDRARAIYGVSAEPADQLLVSIKGVEQSVAEYFASKYSKRLQYPRLPCVNVGSKRPGKETWLPVEVCEVVPGQHCANSDDLDSPAITKLTAMPPAKREKNILEHVKDAAFSNDPYLEAFGMTVKLKMETTDARALEPPCVQYQNTSERPVNGEWSLKDKTMVKVVPFDNWGVLILDEVNTSEVRKFVRTLCDVGRQRGLSLKNAGPVIVHQNEHRSADVEKLVQICYEQVAKRGVPEMLLVVLPDTRSWQYGPVKVMTDTVLGVSCQCVASKNLRKANAAFCANVCLKLNMRLDGKNAVLRDPLPLLSRSPTIIIGADLEHPRPGMGAQPSIAAVVASMDAYSAQYAARLGAQKATSDIQKLPNMLRELFHAYYERTKRKPEHVIYYRDGMGDGQYVDILEAEIRALRKACKMISDNYSPPITFIVANKRHHTRAFPVDRRDADRKGNVKPGTVIDTGVVDPHRFDFFLYGHSSIQGTSKPCHYTVLYDENKLSADDIQLLTYHLGYTFSRSTHAVSVAAPVYYANEAAAHARHFLKEAPEDESSDTVSCSSGSKFLFAKVHKNVQNKMFFI
ncbi:Protein argonaute [Phytophthora rubi]|uniref:Protein argonaute n=1 Tax=Phytophthora rubi TaxID=129364 RepID=A0A6A4G1P0_9STRA|nr:Protein argonaute [Phytophthora rubi]